MKKTTYLVIKCGKTKQVDASKAIQKIVEKKGSCWFAKFGNPIKLSSLKLDDPNHQIILCIALMFDREYQIYSFKIKTMSNDVQPKRGTYPSYYADNIGKVGTWINVEKLEGDQPKMTELLIKSSLHKLIKSIYTAKVGYFFCKHIKD